MLWMYEQKLELLWPAKARTVKGVKKLKQGSGPKNADLDGKQQCKRNLIRKNNQKLTKSQNQKQSPRKTKNPQGKKQKNSKRRKQEQQTGWHREVHTTNWQRHRETQGLNTQNQIRHRWAHRWNTWQSKEVGKRQRQEVNVKNTWGRNNTTK